MHRSQWTFYSYYKLLFSASIATCLWDEENLLWEPSIKRSWLHTKQRCCWVEQSTECGVDVNLVNETEKTSYAKRAPQTQLPFLWVYQKPLTGKNGVFPAPRNACFAELPKSCLLALWVHLLIKVIHFTDTELLRYASVPLFKGFYLFIYF